MKKFIKNYKVQIILCLFFLILSCFSYLYLIRIDQYKSVEKNEKLYYMSCAEYKNTGVFIDKRFDDQNLAEKLNSQAQCDNILKYETVNRSTFFWYNEILKSNVMYVFFPLLFPLFIIIPIAYEMSKKLKSKVIKSELLREKYKKYKIKIYKNSQKNVLISLGLLLMIFLFAYMISGHFYVKYEIDKSYVLFDEDMLQNVMTYLICLVTIVINLSFYANITLIVQSKNTNFLIVVIESLIVILCIWFGTELFLGKLLFKIGFTSKVYDLALYNIFYIPDYDSPLIVLLLISLIYFIISCVSLMYAYKDKEKLIKICESK